MEYPMNAKLQKFTNKRKWAAGLFWTWNVIFLAFMALGFAPTVLPEMLTAVRSGDIPASFIIYAIILTLIPALAVLLGLTWLRRQPERLFALGYGVEGPLMILLALRFFIVRQLTPPMALLLGVAGVGILVYLWHLLDAKVGQRGPILALLHLIGLSCLLLAGLYASIWIAFYALPLGVMGVRSIGDFFEGIWRELIRLDWRSIQWRMVPFTVLGIVLGIYSGTLVVLMPIAVSILYARAWWRGVQAVAASYSRPRALAISVAVIVIIIVVFIPLTRQPQHTAFALLETPPANIDEAKALLAQQEAIRAGLLNAYLAPQRYISAVGEVQHVRDMYTEALRLSDAQARQVQHLYETVARPMLYEPITPIPPTQQSWQNRALINEPAEAAILYEQFFDVSILEGERDEVVQAVRSTWNIDQARANWLAVDDREIYLARQEVTVTEHGDWAEVELYEVYENQTTLRQEVIYYFSLPETAVITGVWLGNSDDRAERFPYIVAPRGAAQATYRNEVRRNLDPALVEQIGPSQYRLRVFPIEPQIWGWNAERRQTTITPGPAMHLWLTWQVMGTDAGWPLPYLAEKRNVYWDNDSVRLLNGDKLEAGDATWLPLTAASSKPIRPAAHRVDFPNGQTVLVQPAQPTAAPILGADVRLAVVLDRSRSMDDLAKATAAALTEIGTWGTAVDVYLTAAPMRGEEASRLPLADLDIETIVYFGGQDAAELLAQFAALQGETTYDAIFVLTDGTGYATGATASPVPMPGAPVWMVHLDGRFPMGYDDDTLAVIQGSGGGAVGSIADAYTRWLASRSSDAHDIVDGYTWRVLPTSDASSPDDDATFAAFAARRLILAEMTAQRNQLDDLTTLDALHVLAREHGIVTPYSSMIVLVTTQQENLLKNLSQQDDRFERELEAVGETTPENALTVTGVPEPEEWLLLALAAALLGWYGWVERTKRSIRC